MGAGDETGDVPLSTKEQAQVREVIEARPEHKVVGLMHALETSVENARNEPA